MTAAVDKVLMAVSAALLVAMAVLMNVEIVLRYGFATSTRVSEEYSGYLFCAATMLGFFPALNRSRFLRIGGLLGWLPLKARAIWEVLIALLGAAFCLLLTVQAWELFQSSRALGSVSEQYSATPLAIPQLVMPVGLAILSIGMLLRGIALGRELWQGRTTILKEEGDVLE